MNITEIVNVLRKMFPPIIKSGNKIKKMLVLGGKIGHNKQNLKIGRID